MLKKLQTSKLIVKDTGNSNQRDAFLWNDKYFIKKHFFYKIISVICTIHLYTRIRRQVSGIVISKTMYW